MKIKIVSNRPVRLRAEYNKPATSSPLIFEKVRAIEKISENRARIPYNMSVIVDEELNRKLKQGKLKWEELLLKTKQCLMGERKDFQVCIEIEGEAIIEANPAYIEYLIETVREARMFPYEDEIVEPARKWLTLLIGIDVRSIKPEKIIRLKP
ncbi:MAG: hypothetical protein DRN81_03560 [Thermoproteota archaeon]|nr:MAG: hypothetical protein DRN81_03560 [Candidatus Korarchaeota archaeon]